MGDEGLEPFDHAQSKTAVLAEGAAECAALSALRCDPGLMQLVEAWSSLPATLRATIAALVDAHAMQADV